MKKLILLLVALAVIAGLGYYVNDLMKNDGKSDTELIEFKVKDIESVDKIVIADAYGNEFTLIKGEGGWTDKDGGCVVPESVDFILDAFEKIEFKGYIEDNAAERFNTIMTAQNTKVDIYSNGAWIKTWYIGPASQDHHAQIMLLDDADYGKSDRPVYMQIKGMHGIIEPRFFADPRKWMCTNIFALGIEEIKSVDIKFNDEPQRSFKVVQDNNKFDVYQQSKHLANVDTAMIFRYLQGYKKVHFSNPNYELTNKEIDSVKATTPFCVMTVTEQSGASTALKCFRIEDNLENGRIENKIEIRNFNRDMLWVELPNGELVKCQYFVFNPLILGHIYFPMDISMLKTHDGMLPIEDNSTQEVK